MAQDILDKIRAAAQQKGVDPDVAVRIASLESSLLAGAKNPRSTAGGLFQVIDDTWRRYGGAPGKKFDVDENVRVGTDILADNTMQLSKALGRTPSGPELYAAHFFGPQQALRVLRAPSDQPLDQVVPKGVLNANPNLRGRTVGEVLAQMEQKVGGAQAAPAAAPQAAVPPAGAAGAPGPAYSAVPRAQPGPSAERAARLAELGPNYQAALAVALLSDEKDEEDRERLGPSEAEKFLAQPPSAARRQLAALDLGYSSPFPKMMAEGGSAGSDEDLARVVQSRERGLPARGGAQLEGQPQEFSRLDPFTQSVLRSNNPATPVSLRAAPMNDPVPFTFSTMPGARAVYDESLRGKNTSGYAVPELRQGDAGPLTKDVMFLNPGVDPVQQSLTRAHEAEHLLAKRGLGDSAAINEKFDQLVKDPAARGRFVRDAANLNEYLRNTYGINSGYFNPEMLQYQGRLAPNLLFEQFATLSGVEQSRNTDLTQDPVLRKTLFKDPKVREAYNALTGLRQTRLDPRDLPPYTPVREKPEGVLEFIRQKMGFAEGGSAGSYDTEPTAAELLEASKPSFRMPSSGKGRPYGEVSRALDSGQGQLAFLKGMTNMPQNLVGAPVDISNLALSAVGMGSKEPVGGSEWLKRKTLEAGMGYAPPADPTLRGFYGAGDITSGLVNPAVPVRGVAKAAGKTGEAARMLAEDFQRYNQALGPAGASYAVKPKGGEFFSKKPEDRVPAEATPNLDRFLGSYQKELGKLLRTDQFFNMGNEQKEVIQQVLGPKARRYFTTVFGTADDPIRARMASGELRPLTDLGRENVPDELIQSLKSGDRQAKEAFEREYDASTFLEGLVLNKKAKAAAEKSEMQKMAAEGVPEQFMNPFISSLNDANAINSPNHILLAESTNAGNIPEQFRLAQQKNVPVYDFSSKSGPSGVVFDFLSPEYLVEGLASLPAKKLKNMSFPEAVTQATQAMQLKVRFDETIKSMGKGRAFPKEFLSQWIEPVKSFSDSKWVQLTDPKGAAVEGALMGHSIGGYYNYANYNLGGPEAFNNQKALIYSLRDKEGYPRVTVEVENSPEGLIIQQIRGKYNSDPSFYRQEIFSLMQNLRFNDKQVTKAKPTYYTVDHTGAGLKEDYTVNWANEYNQWLQNRRDPSKPLNKPPDEPDTDWNQVIL
jgi:hypothetical protein